MIALGLLLLAQLANPNPEIHVGCSYACSITYTIASGPKHGDAVICSDVALTHCGKSVVGPMPTTDPLNPPPGGQANVWMKAGKVAGQYTISITMGGKKVGQFNVWVGPPASSNSKHV